jgi:hypothetical protein
VLACRSGVRRLATGSPFARIHRLQQLVRCDQIGADLARHVAARIACHPPTMIKFLRKKMVIPLSNSIGCLTGGVRRFSPSIMSRRDSVGLGLLARRRVDGEMTPHGAHVGELVGARHSFAKAWPARPGASFIRTVLRALTSIRACYPQVRAPETADLPLSLYCRPGPGCRRPGLLEDLSRHHGDIAPSGSAGASPERRRWIGRSWGQLSQKISDYGVEAGNLREDVLSRYSKRSACVETVSRTGVRPDCPQVPQKSWKITT